MIPKFERVPGVRLEGIGDAWVAFSPASGETMLLNRECAAILEVLSEGCFDEATICSVLARDSGHSASEIAPQLGGSWAQLLESGLLRRIRLTPGEHR